jgi:hypothetical protein
MPALNPRQKAERISAIFRAQQPFDILPAELIPADLNEAYEIRAAYEAIESAAGRGAVAGYKIGLTTSTMQKLCGVDEPCFGAIFVNEVHHCRAELSRCLLSARGRDRDRGAARRRPTAGWRAGSGRGRGRKLYGGDRTA